MLGTLLDRTSGTLLSLGMRSGSAFIKGCFSVALVVAAAIAGCGGGSGADCVSLCQAGQAGSCTTISGDCGKFCAAVEVVAPEAGCSDQYNTYETCLGTPSTICSTMCNSQASALISCGTAYCSAHLSDSNCVYLASHFTG